MSVNRFLFVCLICLFPFGCATFNNLAKAEVSECEYSATVEWTLVNLGFHRQVAYYLEIITQSTWSECKLIIHQVIPSSLYVIKEQLDDLRRLQKLNAILNEFVDIEAPEDISEPHDIYLLSDLSRKNNNVLATSLKLPVHARYHSPQAGGGFRKTNLNAPQIYFSCAQFPSNCSSNDTNLFPCSLDDSADHCQYHNLLYEIDKESLELLVPVGNSDHFDMVVLLTYFVTLAGSIYLCTVILLHLPKP